jgi:hypothetical protein
MRGVPDPYGLVRSSALSSENRSVRFLPPIPKSGGCDLYATLATPPGGRLWVAGQASPTLKSGASTRV